MLGSNHEEATTFAKEIMDLFPKDIILSGVQQAEIMEQIIPLLSKKLPNLNEWESALKGRYCSQEAKLLAGETFRWSCARRVWLSTLETQIEMGLLQKPPSSEAIQKFKDKLFEFDWDKIREIERELKHDVKAHITYITKYLVPELGQTIHLGMTSEDAVSNAEILQQDEWMIHVLRTLGTVIDSAFKQILRYKSLAMLGETHLQPAAAVTFGKRLAVWTGPLIEDFQDLNQLLESNCLKGVRGATGTYEALLKMYGGDDSEGFIQEFESKLSQKLGKSITKLAVAQTAPRSWDIKILDILSRICTNLGKMATDIRHLARTGEIGEPRKKNQVGSSAMPWKQNPMMFERLNSLGRIVSYFAAIAHETARTQGLERTLDDSAGRRIYMNEAFLLTDACLRLAVELMEGFNVFEFVIGKRLEHMLPFLVTEDILASAVKKGDNREDVHEWIQVHAKAVVSDMSSGKIQQNDILIRLENDEKSPVTNLVIPSDLDPHNYTGACDYICAQFNMNFSDVLHPLEALGGPLKLQKSEV